MKLSLISCGKALGSREVDNHYFASYLDTSDEWIRERSGIVTRRWVEEEKTLDLALEAAEACLEKSSVDRSRIRLVICASVTADETVPALSALLQEKLGLSSELFAFDLNAACSGYVYGLEVARKLLASYPEGSLALVVGAEVLSRHTDMEDRSNCFLFGDGAGASLWTLTEGEEDLFSARTMGNRDMLSLGYIEPISMDGRAVFRFAVSEMTRVIRQLLAKASLDPEEIDLFLLHQANQRIIDAIGRNLGLDMDRFPSNIDRYGNTSSASIGILMEELLEEGSLAGRKNICLAGFGGGMSCGALLMKGHEIHVA